MLLLSYSLFAVGLVAFAWGGLRSTNVGGLVGARPRPPLLKPTSTFNVAIVLGGAVLCAVAVALLIVQLSSRI